ncbi:HpcH/HpaI aldolase/citrate lyase family protein [Streptomyces sp. NPDC056405]|uniref:HpcH/HpaI aldolase/citrate lyase family protein n=1 Tax=Streptomyces sp. NPDC056405 TaxID=3345811 RepID=UPI0035DBF4D6
MTTAPAGVWLITPGHTPTRFASAHTAGADVALVDLEDSVPPAAKPAARTTARAFFTRPDTPASCALGIRINAPTTREAIQDLAALADYPVPPAVVLIPKVEAPRDLGVVAAALDVPGRRPLLYGLIETPHAVQNLSEIVRSDHLSGLLFGTADYAGSIGSTRAWEPMLYARSALVTHAAAAGIPVIDSPYFDLDDQDGLHAESVRVRDLGFRGKSCVHPRQVATVADVFRPTPEQIAHARAVVAAAEDAAGGIVRVGHQMIGPPMVQDARDLLARTRTDETAAGATQ